MNIAIAQMNVQPGAFGQTVEHMLAFCERAKNAGARLTIFPAHALAGGCPLDDADQEGFIADLLESLQDFAEETVTDCLVPVVGEFAGQPLLEAVLVRDHEVHALRMENEFEAFRREFDGAEDGEEGEDDLITFEFDGLRFAIAFSNEDLDALGSLGHAFDAIVFASTYGFSHDNPSTQLAAALTESRYPGDVERTGSWLIAAGTLGIIDTQVFSGGSFVLAPWGELAAEGPSFEEALVTCNVDPTSEGPLANPLVPDVPDRLLTLMSAIIAGLNGFCRSENVRDVVLVMDGSLASSTLATLACDALGPMHVHAIVGAAENPQLETAARELAGRLRLDATMAPDGASRDQVEIMRAELVRSSGALALLDLDKTGFCLENRAGTLCVGGLAPLGDVYRSDVVALARLRNTISPVIGPFSMRAWKVPQIEGMEKRYITASSQLEFIDYVLSGRIEWGRSYTQIVEDDRGGELAERVLELLRIRRMARLAAPRVLIVSSQSLMEMPQSFGLRWHDRVRDQSGDSWKQFEGFLQSLAKPQVKQSAEGMQREIGETLAFLRDLAATGGLFDPAGFSAQDGAQHRGRPGEGGESWSFGSPFSEN